MSLVTFVINLDTSTDRLIEITEHLSEIGIPFSRISAVDGRERDTNVTKSYDAATARKIIGRQMMGGEIGCFLSHRRALEAFLNTGEPHGLILEDDAIVNPELIKTAKTAIDWLDSSANNDWNLINVGRARLPIHTVVHDLGGRSLVAAHYAPMGAYALVWSRKGAERFLGISKKISIPVDNTLQNWLCRDGGGFAITPELAFVSYAESVIDQTGHGDRPTARGHFERNRFHGLRKQRRLWKNRFWAYVHKTSFSD